MAKKAKDNKVARWIYAADPHVPYEDQAYWNCLLSAIKIVKPQGFCHLGDFAEAESVAHWQWKRRKKPPVEHLTPVIDAEIEVIQNKFTELNNALDDINCKSRVFCQGNHDEWFDRFVEEHPYLPQYRFDRFMEFKKRGWKYYRIGERFKNGKLYAYHGHLYGGIHHAKNHLQKMGVNVIYGHWHDEQTYSITHEDGEKTAWCIGCGKSFKREASNEWLGGRPINWCHCLAIVDFFGGGFFTVHVERIINGRFSLWGEVIDGN